MSRSDEPVVGVVPVTAKLALGSEQLRLFLTNSRFIAAHLGKRGAGAQAVTSLVGKFGQLLEDAIKGGRERPSKQSEDLTPKKILGADKDNFFVNYDDVVSVQVDGSGGVVRITVLTKDDKFQFETRASLEEVANLFEGVLGSRVTTTRGTSLPRSRINR